MKPPALVVLVVVGALGCKGAAEPSTPGPAPSSDPPPASASAVPAVVPPTTTASGACSCKDVRVGGIYPLQSGHAVHDPTRDTQVLSIDPKACSAQVKELRTGAVRTEKCDSGFFDPPYINPAG